MGRALSGFDMGQTLLWYQTHRHRLLEKISELTISDCSPPYPIESKEYILMEEREIYSLLSLFPENAHLRTVLGKIVGKPPTWFHRDTTPQKPIPTTNPRERLSSTAIIPGYTDPSRWTGENPTLDICLYAFDKTVPHDIVPIILSEALLHEFGHTLITPCLYIGGYKLRLPDSTVVEKDEFLVRFAGVAEKFPAISHYSSGYRRKDGCFPKEPVRLRHAISEELCESIAAYFLGFSFCRKEKRTFSPFDDRPEVKKLVEDFLNAERVG